MTRLVAAGRALLDGMEEGGEADEYVDSYLVAVETRWGNLVVPSGCGLESVWFCRAPN